MLTDGAKQAGDLTSDMPAGAEYAKLLISTHASNNSLSWLTDSSRLELADC